MSLTGTYKEEVLESTIEIGEFHLLENEIAYFEFDNMDESSLEDSEMFMSVGSEMFHSVNELSQSVRAESNAKFLNKYKFRWIDEI